MSCKCAIFDEDTGRYDCSVSGDGCMYMFPDSKQCAKDFGEGPDVIEEDRAIGNSDKELDCLDCEFTRVEENQEPCCKCEDYSEWKTDEWMHR